jgi:hypothetical protein
VICPHGVFAATMVLLHRKSSAAEAATFNPPPPNCGLRGRTVMHSGSVYSGLHRAFCVASLFGIVLAFSSQASAGTAQLVVKPLSISFGNVAVGSSGSQLLTLANSGGTKITISQVSVSGTGFALSGMNYPVTLAGGHSVTCTVTFTPPSAATDNGTIVVSMQSSAGKHNSSPSSSNSVPLSGTGYTSASVSVAVSPTSSTLSVGQQSLFSATVSGTTNTSVIWTASAGTVSSSGLYTAPSTAGTYTVTATSSADSTKSASATVTVSQPTQISISVSPTTASVQTGGQQQFAAYVSGTSNTAVTWKATVGTITAAGLYTAPTTAGIYTVTAVSAADGTTSASATVGVTAPQNVGIAISPTTVSMPAKWTQQFAATVSGSTNTGVTWAVTQGSGTITQSGMYTAPSVTEMDIVTVTTQADTTKSASASITVAAPHSVTLNWSPSTTAGVTYNVYRSTVSGGPYSLLSSGLTSTSYVDSTVQSGSAYYYVTTAADSAGESGYSNMVQAVIPMP